MEILSKITESVVNVAELVEAEARLARHHVVHIVAAWITMLGLVLVAVFGLSAMAAGLMWLLASVIGWAGALAIGGGVLAVAAGMAAFSVYWKVR